MVTEKLVQHLCVFFQDTLVVLGVSKWSQGLYSSSPDRGADTVFLTQGLTIYFIIFIISNSRHFYLRCFSQWR